MIRPVRSVNVTSESPEAEKNRSVNDFIRLCGGIPSPNTLNSMSPALRAMFQRDNGDQKPPQQEGEQIGGD